MQLCSSILVLPIGFEDFAVDRVRSRAALLRIRISPRTPQARSPTRQRSVRIDLAYQSACSPTGRDSGLKSRRVPVRIRPGAPYAPVADGEASGFQTRDWVFESPLGCHAPQQQVASGRVATSVCAVRFRGGASSFVCGGVDELLKSPVPKTGVSPQGPPRVEFPPPPPPISTAYSIKWM
jgi:hypothetical protein